MARAQTTASSTPRITYPISGLGYAEFTIAIWALCNDDASNYDAAFELIEAGTDAFFAFALWDTDWNASLAPDGVGGNVIDEDDDTALVEGRWYHLLFRRVSSTSHHFHVHDPVGSRTSTLSDTSTSISTFGNADLIAIGNSGYEGTWAYSMDGVFAEPAIWSTDLSTDEIASVQLGVSPLLIRPQSLVFYQPLLSGERSDYISGEAPTVVGSWTDAPHPTDFTTHGSGLWVPAWYGAAAGGETYQRAIIEGVRLVG